MANAIILHGSPGPEEYYNPHVPPCSHQHWLPWLQKQLIVRGIEAHTPEIPKAFEPDYPVWLKEFERYDIDDQTLLVGHSCGGGFIVKWLSEHKDIRVSRVVLVAPWIDPFDELSSDFFDFELDPQLAERTAGLTVFNSDNDGKYILESVSILRQTIHHIQYREFHNYGHFCIDDMHSYEFPELLTTLVD